MAKVIASPQSTDAEGHLARNALSVVRRLAEAKKKKPAADDLRLGLLFMAAAPEGAVPLRFEDEEAAILRAVNEPEAATGVADAQPIDLDLFGEDTGNLKELVRRLDILKQQRLDVLHLSGHGSALPPGLSMEDPEGGEDGVDVKRLVESLRRNLKHLPLVVVSACETGAHGVADSIGEALVRRAGAAAAIVWAGKVLDSDATAFAAWLYHYLAKGERIDDSVAEARRELLLSGRRHWHLPRLLLGSSDGGEVATPGGRTRTVNPLRYPYSGADDLGRPGPVCHEAAFVGRRRVMQRALSALRSHEKCGIVLTGIGRQGKSSLAERLSDRLRDSLKPVRVWGRLDAARLHARFAEAFGEPLRQNHTLERDEAGARFRADLERWLQEDRTPLLLILDDFEQNLQDDGTMHSPKAEALPAVEAVLEAFRATPGTRSRLVITSRAAFVAMSRQGIPLHVCLEEVKLPELNPSERSRMRVPIKGRVVAPWLRQSVEAAGRGNPGLTEALLRLAATDPGAAEGACARIEAAKGEVGKVWQSIAVKELLASAFKMPGADWMLRVAQLFDLPVPGGVLDRVAQQVGVANPATARQRLSDLGIIEERGRDRHALNGLVASRAAPLSSSDKAAMARTRVFVVLVSGNWAQGWYNEDEVARAISLCRAHPGRGLVPVILGPNPLPPHDLPYGLGHVQPVVMGAHVSGDGAVAVLDAVRSLLR